MSTNKLQARLKQIAGKGTCVCKLNSTENDLNSGVIYMHEQGIILFILFIIIILLGIIIDMFALQKFGP